jgi:hypothetical protein
MAGERFVVLGLAPARSAWFDAVSRWTNAATIAAEFVKCVSAEEVRARLAGGRRFSALLIDGSSPALDRDMVEQCRARGIAVLVVADPRRGPVATEIGVGAHLSAPFTPGELMDALSAHAQPVAPGTALPPALDQAETTLFWQAPLYAVSGPGGTGTSTISIALASGLGHDPRLGHRVLLADLARRAEQAVLHDSPELGPGLQELVEAHRLRRPGPDEVTRMTFDVPERGYNLLLGLRQPEAWGSLRPRAFDASLVSLRRAFQVVVADLTGDFEGEAESGSLDVEERNHPARSTARQATVNLAVGSPGLKGVHSLALHIRQMVRAGVDPGRIVAVVNRSSRHPKARAEASRALVSVLADSGIVLALAGAVHVPERRLEDAMRDCAPIPAAICDPVTSAARAVADRLADTAPPDPGWSPVAPGTLGSWASDPGLNR